MSQHLHQRIRLDQGDIISVSLGQQTNVLLMDDNNDQQYKRGQSYRYHGGLFTTTPARISAPNSGFWNLVLNLGGRSGRIKYSISIQ